jgi:hypothetical protein
MRTLPSADPDTREAIRDDRRPESLPNPEKPGPNRVAAALRRLLSFDGRTLKGQGPDASGDSPGLEIKPLLVEFTRGPGRNPVAGVVA